jgi:hypothetical protein
MSDGGVISAAMTAAFLIQTLISLLALAGLVGLAAWLGLPRDKDPLKEERARALFAEDFPDTAVAAVWIAPDGASALGRAGDEALIAYRAGDGFVLRSIPWNRLSHATFANGRAMLKLDDVAAPKAIFDLGEGENWPPRRLAPQDLAA